MIDRLMELPTLAFVYDDNSNNNVMYSLSPDCRSYDFRGCAKIDANVPCTPGSSNTLPAILEHNSDYYLVVRSSSALFGNYRVIVDNKGDDAIQSKKNS